MSERRLSAIALCLSALFSWWVYHEVSALPGATEAYSSWQKAFTTLGVIVAIAGMLCWLLLVVVSTAEFSAMWPSLPVEGEAGEGSLGFDLFFTTVSTLGFVVPICLYIAIGAAYRYASLVDWVTSPYIFLPVITGAIHIAMWLAPIMVSSRE